MQRRLRIAYLIAAILLLLLMPWGETSVLLVLFVAAVLGAAASILRGDTETPTSLVTIGGDAENLALYRRVVPQLRMRRPVEAVEAQIQWREAVAAYRRRRQFS